MKAYYNRKLQLSDLKNMYMYVQKLKGRINFDICDWLIDRYKILLNECLKISIEKNHYVQTFMSISNRPINLNIAGLLHQCMIKKTKLLTIAVVCKKNWSPPELILECCVPFLIPLYYIHVLTLFSSRLMRRLTLYNAVWEMRPSLNSYLICSSNWRYVRNLSQVNCLTSERLSVYL